MAIGPGNPLPPRPVIRSALKPIIRQPLGLPAAKAPEPATVAELVAFFADHGHHTANAVRVVGDTVHFSAGPYDPLWTTVTALTDAFAGGSISPNQPLVRSLLLFEMLHNVQLPGVIIDCLIERFHQAVTTTDPEAAYYDAVLQVVCASSVETYANCQTGMARDLLQISRFSQDAKQGLALGGMLSVFKKKETDLKQKVIEVHQYALTETLNHFMHGLAEARRTGDYARAFDLQKRFFEISAMITETEYWRKRAKLRGVDMAEELDASAVGRIRSDATCFADAFHSRTAEARSGQSAETPPTDA